MIIGLSGFAGSGKSTVAELLVTNGFRMFCFADALKDSLAIIFNWSRSLLEGDTIESRTWRETTDIWWSQRLSIEDFTPRKAMQMIGTDLFRNQFHSDIWIASLERKLISNANTNIVVPDCRFPNEIQLIKNLNGIMVRINRTEDHQLDSVHESERAWTAEQFDLVIDNTGTIEDLYNLIGQELIPLVSK